MKIYRLTASRMYSQILTDDMLQGNTLACNEYELAAGEILYELITHVFFVPRIGKFISTRSTVFPYECIKEISLYDVSL